jgi:hypothetical protein
MNLVKSFIIAILQLDLSRHHGSLLLILFRHRTEQRSHALITPKEPIGHKHLDNPHQDEK